MGSFPLPSLYLDTSFCSGTTDTSGWMLFILLFKLFMGMSSFNMFPYFQFVEQNSICCKNASIHSILIILDIRLLIKVDNFSIHWIFSWENNKRSFKNLKRQELVMQAFLQGQIMFSVFFPIVPDFGQRFELTLVFGSIFMTYDTAY